jgi:hypothetical protein
LRKNFRPAAVAGDVPLEGLDIVVSILPEVPAAIDARQLAQELREDADDEHVLVVGPVEHADASPLRQRLHVPPQKVVIELFTRRLLEREDLAHLLERERHTILLVRGERSGVAQQNPGHPGARVDSAQGALFCCFREVPNGFP